MKYPFRNWHRVVVMLGILASLTCLHVNASVIRVSSIPDLQSAINNASPGDMIILANGTYLNATLTISASNITVKAAAPGGVYLNGPQFIDITGNFVTFSGFQFTSGDIGDAYVIDIYGSHNLVTQLNFSGYSAKKYISIHAPSQHNEITYCNFENKPVTAPIGNLIHIDPDTLIPGYHKIRYCSFKNMPGAGGDNGNECIRISNGATSTYISRTIVEFCYFTNTGLGDSEAISVKCRENVLRYNTFTNNQNAMMVFRNGDNNAAYGNYFIGAGGIRVKEANNIYCYNNYFERAGVSGTMGAVKYDYISPNLKNINFLYNTFVDCGDINLGGTGPTNNTWANNIFKKTAGNIFTGSTAGISWAGNICMGTVGISIASGMTSADPLLVVNSDGYYGLSPASPAIDASNPNVPAILDVTNIDDDPFVLLDISGQARPAANNLKDAGCDEYTSGAITNRPLKVSDVGPVYVGGTAAVVSDDHKFKAINDAGLVGMLQECYPNPFNPTTTIRFRVPSQGNVTLQIYDQLGREVVTLHDGAMPAGDHQSVWDAGQLPSGVYFCRLHMEGYWETKKLILIQ